MKKIILTVFAATSLLIYSTPTLAFSLSVGVPIGHTYTGEVAAGSTQNESDGSSGYFLGVQLPFAFGIGMDSYKTKIKNSNDIKYAVDIYNIFYQLPIPVVNLIIGLGTGNDNLECDAQYVGGPSCSTAYKKGSATQWYTSIGLPIIPLFDIHLSYRSITSKNIKEKNDDGSETKLDLSSNVTGIGLAFNF